MSYSKSIQALSFAEIIKGRDSSVRVTQDHMIYAVDLVMVMTGKDRDHAGQALRGISDEKFSSLKISERNTGGCGNSRTKLVSFEHALELIMVLPGDEAKRTRVQFADILKRYMAGDKTLISEINANAASNSPIAQMAKAAAGIEPEDPETMRKRVKREDLELMRLEDEIHERRASTQDKRIKNMDNFLGLMTRIRPDWQQTDARFRLQTEDMIKNIMTVPTLGSNPLLIKDGEPEIPQATPASLSISQLVQEMKIRALKHGDLCRVGALAAKRYREAHDEDPPKHPQWVDGVERKVNSYTEADRGMLVGVLHELGLAPGSSSASSVASDDY